MLLTTVPEWDAAIDALREQPRVAFDVETNGTRPQEGDRICMVSLYTPETGPFSIPFRMQMYPSNLPIENLRRMQELVDRTELVGQFLGPFDLGFLRVEGVDTSNARIFDTLMGTQLYDDSLSRYGLKPLGVSLLGMPDAADHQDKVKRWLDKNKRDTYDFVPVSLLGPYAEQDVILTWDLMEHVRPEIESREGYTEHIELDMWWSRFIGELGDAGLPLDMELTAHEMEVHYRRAAEIQRELAEGIPGFNPNSTAHIKQWCQQNHGVRLEDTEAWTLRTAFQGTPAQADVEKILEFRARIKSCSTWLGVFLARARKGRGRVRTSFGIDASAEIAKASGFTRTLRLRSSHPNLQAVPTDEEPRFPDQYVHRVRHLFKANEGKVLVGMDYSQIEVRKAAHYAREETMIEELSKKDGDIHQRVADELGFPRYRAKRLNLGTIYSIGAETLATQLTRETLRTHTKREANHFLNAYRARYSGLVEMSKIAEATFRPTCPDAERLRCRCPAPHRGYLKLWDGRLAFCGPNDEPHKAFNLLIQTGVSQLLKRGMRLVDDYIKDQELEARMILQVHDEIIFEMPIKEEKKHAEKIRQMLQTIGPPKGWRVPIVVDKWTRERWSMDIPEEMLV